MGTVRGALRGGRVQELFFQRFSKSIEKVAGPAAAAILFYVFETFPFWGHFQAPFFQIVRKSFPDLKKRRKGPQIEKFPK